MMGKNKEEIIEKQFDSYCKTVLRNKARDIYREKEKCAAKQVLLSEIPEQVLDGLAVYDDYLVDSVTMTVAGVLVTIRDVTVALAVGSLHDTIRKVVLMYFFLDMSDTEIADYLNVARGTVYYYRQKGLKQIKKYLEGTTHEEI
ncbi:sigma-70 family RNA polymerase sigma factor [Enterococcus faecalis]|nr:sigma-70 family RNA polymerase sigma factor [Enterococcus faecalis]